MMSTRNKYDAGGPISEGALSADRLVARLTFDDDFDIIN